MRKIAACGEHASPFAFGTQARLTHQLGNSFARDASSPILQLDMQAWTAVSATMSAKFLSNLFGELGIFSLALTGWTLAPSVKATFRDTKHSAHDDNGEFLLVLFDKLVFHLDSREKMPTAFFRISRSWRRSSFSRFRRRFSRLELGLVPFPWERFRAVLCQLLTPLMNRGIGNTQLAGDLCNRLAAGLSQPYGFLSGSQGALLPLSPLRTGLVPLKTSGSSTSRTTRLLFLFPLSSFRAAAF